ncbi:hypothetical protein [Cohnella sp. 56]|uniref:hypothetical protein n=1 Tax=Cohnella sp. 56 TaxID=3113722 RepID=UPI0030EA82F6
MKKTSRVNNLRVCLSFVLACCLLNGLPLQPLKAATIGPVVPITVNGENFVKSDGTIMHFWGMNVAALYPTHTQADKLASTLAKYEINLVRLHHNYRNSLDWNPNSQIGALVTYGTDTRTPNTEAWDRYDYFNSKLRSAGIYESVSLFGTRRFLPGDVDIQSTNSQDRQQWMDAIVALNKMPSNLDLYKMLPMIDERSALLMEEQAAYLLNHINPYTGIAYKKDAQILNLEIMNETSSEYAVNSGNQFASSTYPAVSYFKNKLQIKWDAYTAAHGVVTCDIYAPSTDAQKYARGDFLRELDENYFNRIKTKVRNLGSIQPLVFSNLWRGESFQKMESEVNDLIEDHFYIDPLITRGSNDYINLTNRSAITGKPFLISELNQSQTDASINANKQYRTMLEIATSAYSSYNNWSGVEWFAWLHGDRNLDANGNSTIVQRTPSTNSNIIGEMQSDAMFIDHLRTTGLIVKRGLVGRSASPKVLYVDEPMHAKDYNTLMNPKYSIIPGWQNVYSIRRAFGAVPSSQLTANFMAATPSNPLTTTNNQIIKDTVRKQFTVAAPYTEAFSGYLDANAPAGLAKLQLTGTSGSFASVVAVSNTGNPLATTNYMFLSRTALDASNNEITGPAIKLKGVTAASGSNAWYYKITRPIEQTTWTKITETQPGEFNLPAGTWYEIELRYGNGSF